MHPKNSLLKKACNTFLTKRQKVVGTLEVSTLSQPTTPLQSYDLLASIEL